MAGSVGRQGASKGDHGDATARRARRTAAFAALAACVSAAGCGEAPIAARGDAPEAIAAAPAALKVTCDKGRRWVASITGSACAEASGWVKRPIVTWTSGGVTRTECSYEWPSGAPSAADLTTLETNVAPDPIEPDCMVVGALGEAPQGKAGDLAAPSELAIADEDGLEPTAEAYPVAKPGYGATVVAERGQQLRQVLRQRFAERSGAVTLPLSANPDPALNPVPIRVAVLDSEPDSDDPTTVHPGALRHGAVMSGLIRDLTCPGWPASKGACVSGAATKLALPLLGNGQSDPVHGGEFGTMGLLAQAITDAVEDWRKIASADPDELTFPRLVLNLSLGAQPVDPCVADPTDPAAPLPSKALYRALLFAACHGALVIAAAGNDPGGGPYSPGGTCPGAWATLPSLDQAECAARFDIDYSAAPFGHHPPFSDTKAPLLYAAHGVDGWDHPVTNTRDGARSWVAAPGLLGVSSDTTPSLPAPLTGSSVGAAALSGIAAAVWSYRPELSSRQIMNLLHDKGVPLGNAELCPPDLGGLCDSRRASLCDALAAACVGAQRCAKPPSCPPNGPLGAQNAPFGALVEGQITDLELNASSPAPLGPTWVTPPSQQYSSVGSNPSVQPQPTRPPCGPACTLSLVNSILLFTIDPAYTQAAIGAVTLRLEGSGGLQTYDLGDNFAPGSLQTFSLLKRMPQVHTATLSYQVGGTASISEQIAVH